VNGFRVSATNLPVAASYQVPDATSRIIQNKISYESPIPHKSIKQESKPYKNLTERKEPTYNKPQNIISYVPQQVPQVQQMQYMQPAVQYMPQSYSPYSPFSQYYLGQEIAPIPISPYSYQAYPSPISPIYSQYHAQDELGQYSYGYSGGPSSKVEVKTLDGITRGGYSYVDANGILQKVNYVADPVNGFRVAATNLPMSNMGPAYYPAAEIQMPEFSVNLIDNNENKFVISGGESLKK